VGSRTVLEVSVGADLDGVRASPMSLRLVLIRIVWVERAEIYFSARFLEGHLLQCDGTERADGARA